MKAEDFYSKWRVFTAREFHQSSDSSERACDALLQRHTQAGYLVRIRRGLYAQVPPKPRGAAIDRYLIVDKLAEDATVAFGAALAFHHLAQPSKRVHYLARQRLRPFSFKGVEFIPVQPPEPSRSQFEFGGGVIELVHGPTLLKVTTVARTFADLFDAPQRCEGWDVLRQALDAVGHLDLEELIAQVRRTGSAIAAARAGWVLERAPKRLQIKERHLKELRALAPREPRYLDSSRTPGTLVANWNLVVSPEILALLGG